MIQQQFLYFLQVHPIFWSFFNHTVYHFVNILRLSIQSCYVMFRDKFVLHEEKLLKRESKKNDNIRVTYGHYIFSL